MDLDQLQAFERVVREGSFSRAALALGLGQPAVSARNAALEAALGGALFTRGRRIGLTALGESFRPYVRRALEVLGEGVEAARLAQVGQRGRVRLGTLGSLAGGLVGPAVAEFMRAHPEVECSVRSADHEVVVEWLLDGLVELALFTWPCVESATAELTPLFVFREPVVLVAHPSHPLAARRTVSRDELARLGRPFLRLRWWPTQHASLAAVAALAARAGSIVEAPMETARHLLLQGRGVAFFARTYLADELARGALVELAVRGAPPIFRDSALVRRRRSTPLSPAAADLSRGLGAQAARLAAPARPSDANPSRRGGAGAGDARKPGRGGGRGKARRVH